MLKLVMITGPEKGRHVRVADAAPLTIGRDRGRLRLHDSRCSKRHAEITFMSGAWILRDAGSSNGTFLNKAKLEGIAELERGDIIQCGRVAMRVREADASGMPESDTGPAVGFAEPLADAAAPGGNELSDATPSAPPTPAQPDTAGEEIDLDALFDEADRAEGIDTEPDEDEGPIEAPPRAIESTDTPIDMSANMPAVDKATAPPHHPPDGGEAPPDAATDADTTPIADAADDADAPGDVLIESGIFDPVPGEAGWGAGDTHDEVAGTDEAIDAGPEGRADDAIKTPAQASSTDPPESAAPAALPTAEQPPKPTSEADSAAQAADEAEHETLGPIPGATTGSENDGDGGDETPETHEHAGTDARADAAADEPAPGDLSDQVTIDDDLTDAGKMPGTTQVLPSETLAAAAGGDRSAALANQSDAYEFEDEGVADGDDDIGLADDEPAPSVFDQAIDDTPAATLPADEAVDTHEDLIRIGDDEPIERGPTAPEPTPAQAAGSGTHDDADVLPMPADEAEDAEPPHAAPGYMDLAEASADDSGTPCNAVPAAERDDTPRDEPPADHADEYNAPAQVETAPTQIETVQSESDARTADDAASTTTPDRVADTAPAPGMADEVTDADPSAVASESKPAAPDDDDTAPAPSADSADAADVDALRAALAQIDDGPSEGPGEADHPIETAAVVDAALTQAPAEIDETAVVDSRDDDAEALEPLPNSPADDRARDEGDAELDAAFDLDDDSADAEIAAALDSAVGIDSIDPEADAGSSHTAQSTDNTSVNEASPEPTASADDDADLERIDDIDPAAQAELDPSETDYDAPLPASFGRNAGSASAVARELDADTAQEHAALIDETPLDAEGVVIEPDAPPRTAQPPQGQNPTTTLPPVEPKRSYRSAGPPARQGSTLRRLGFAAAILLILAVGAALYLGVINPGLITGKTNRPTNPQPGPASQASADNLTHNAGPGPLTQRNTPDLPAPPGTDGPGVPAVPARDINDIPDTPTPGNTPPAHTAGIARTPNPFDNAPRVIGGDALAGRTTDDRSVTRPGTPPPDENLLTPGPRPLPPIILPQPGVNPSPINPTDSNTGAINPGTQSPTPLAGNNDDNTTDNAVDPTAPIDGDKLVFLVDCSGSLVDSLPQMLLWLHDAIATLQPGETFTIIFFKKDEAFEPSPAGLKPLTRAYLADLDREWLDPNASPVLPTGRSDPEAAFALALSYSPSDIYLLSDESFAQRAGDTTPEEAVAFVTQTLGDADVRLHGVQFFYDSGESTLQTLAEQFDGSYEFVAETRHPDRDPIDLLEELENRNP